jgi:hypothetical protein
MKKTVGYILEYIWMFILLGFLWPKGDVKNREEDLARLYKAKDQIEINDENKIKIKYNNKSSDDNHYDRDSEKAFI